MLNGMRNLEQELKLSLEEREYDILSALTEQKPQLQTNYYFCSENFPQNTMVRIREKGGVYLLCVKRLLQQNRGVTVCDERECEVSPNFARNLLSRGIRSSELNGMLKTDFDEDLRCVGKMDTYRTAFCLKEWHLELDKNLYLNKCDYELECESANVQQLNELENYLFYAYGVVIKHSVSKSKRFFEALNGKV